MSSDAILILRRLALDVGLWYCAPAIFMAIYIAGFSLPIQALAPHLLIVALPLVALIFARLAISHWVSNVVHAGWIAAALVSSTLAIVIAYYALVLGGLSTWGGVISWNVITSYAMQLPAYTATLGLAPLTTTVLAILAFAAIFAAVRTYLLRFDWTRIAARWISGTTLGLVLLFGSCMLAAWAYTFAAAPAIAHSEPVSLTLFHNHVGTDLQGHQLDPLKAETLDRREDEARASYVPAANAPRRNLVLIVIDAQRPDHMGVYGYPRDTTPNLSRLARARPVRMVEFVHSSCPDTACGMLSLSSSKFPRQFSFRPFTLHQVMRRNGYRVHMILSGDHTQFYGLKSFYGEVDSFYDGGSQADGYFTNDDQLVLDRLATTPSWDGSPTMFQFHLMSTHVLSKHDDVDAHFKPATTYVRRFYDPDIGPGSRIDESTTNYYDNGVLKSDGVVHSLLTLLKKKRYLENTLVVITADHGEALGEHGLFVHMNSVREEVLRIPLLLIAYGYQPEHPLLPRAAPAQVDIAPTILVELGLPVPGTWSGVALQEPHNGDVLHFEGNENFGLIDARDPKHVWKYWANAKTGAEHAFDLLSDPHETHDRLAQVPENLRLEWRVRVLPGTPLAF